MYRRFGTTIAQRSERGCTGGKDGYKKGDGRSAIVERPSFFFDDTTAGPPVVLIRATLHGNHKFYTLVATIGG